MISYSPALALRIYRTVDLTSVQLTRQVSTYMMFCFAVLPILKPAYAWHEWG